MPAPSAAPSPRSPLERVRNVIDGVLVFDVFLVLGGAVWFAVALACHARRVEAPLELFQRLWEPVFTPAIGLLMGAALLSGMLSWWQRRGRN
jgi:hypothetical protein